MFRRNRRHAHHGQVELNVIPLIDVVFFLLVFYVISTSFVQESAVPIDRPSSNRASQVQSSYVQVVVVKSGAIYIGSMVVDLRALADNVRTSLDRNRTERVVVMADREVPTGLLLKVMDACQKGGAKSVNVAANKDGG